MVQIINLSKGLIAQMDLAARIHQPVIIHLRHADQDMLSIMNQFPTVKVFHCYATHLNFFESLDGDQNLYHLLV